METQRPIIVCRSRDNLRTGSSCGLLPSEICAIAGLWEARRCAELPARGGGKDAGTWVNEFGDVDRGRTKGGNHTAQRGRQIVEIRDSRDKGSKLKEKTKI